jgi:hypothetical protein
MSFLTGTNVELIASSAVAGSALANSTTTTVVSVGAAGAYLPIGFFYTNAVGKKLRVVADGILSTTATPTIKIGVTLDTVLGTVNASQVSNFFTGAVTTPAAGAVSNSQWHLEVELCVQSIAYASGSSSGQTVGIVGYGWLAQSVSGIDATAAGTVFLAGTTTAVNYPVNQAYFVDIAAVWGTSSASNTLTCENVSVYGCN